MKDILNTVHNNIRHLGYIKHNLIRNKIYKNVLAKVPSNLTNLNNLRHVIVDCLDFK